MEEFGLRTRIVWGSGALAQLSQLENKRVLVISDGFLAKNGLLDRVLRGLGKATVGVYDGVAGEPTLPMVAQGVAELNRLDGEVVVAFGGGSAMDCAKALGYCAGRRLPVWCIPTTAGTGSEVTSFAVLTDPETGLKYPLVDDSLIPQVAILDSQFLETVPPKVTADSGMDVLTHAAEAYVSIRANPFTDALAEKSFAMAFAKLPKAYAGDKAAKEEMLLASTLAGLAFNAAGLGVCHGLAHALGGRLHAPHGRVNALLLPHVMEANAKAPAAAKKYARLAALCGLSANARGLAGAIRRLTRKLGMAERLEGTADLTLVASDAQKDRCTPDNPRALTPDELKAILREVTV